MDDPLGSPCLGHHKGYNSQHKLEMCETKCERTSCHTEVRAEPHMVWWGHI